MSHGARGDASRMVVPVRPDGRRPPLVVLSAGHGDVLSLVWFGRRLAPDQPVYVLQPPEPSSAGRSGRLAERVARYLEALRAVRPRGPYVLAGNSSGGLVALELARAAGEQGEAVELVALFDTPNAITWANVLSHRIGRAILPRLSAAVLDRRTRVLREVSLDAGFHATIDALRGHAPGPAAAPIAFFRAERQLSWESLAYGNLGVSLPRWRAVAAAGMTVDAIPGIHSDMIRSSAPVLAERLTARIEAAGTVAAPAAGA